MRLISARRPVEGQLTDLVPALRREGINADAQLRRAPPAEAVVDVARSEHADLIVMASHQRHGFDRWVHGSVTGEVLQHTSTPLLVVPPSLYRPAGAAVEGLAGAHYLHKTSALRHGS